MPLLGHRNKRKASGFEGVRGKGPERSRFRTLRQCNIDSPERPQISVSDREEVGMQSRVPCLVENEPHKGKHNPTNYSVLLVR